MTRVEVGDEDVFVILREVVSRVERPPAPPTPVRLHGAGRRRGPEPPPPSSVWKEYEHVGTGRFIVVIPHTPGNYGSSNPAFSWEERNKRKALEDSLGEIVVGIVAAAERFREWRARVAANAREAAERARRAAEAERLRLADAARVQELDRQLAAHGKAQQVRAYASALHAAVVPATGSDGAAAAAATVSWIAWMQAYADQIDPVRRAVREVAVARDPRPG